MKYIFKNIICCCCLASSQLMIAQKNYFDSLKVILPNLSEQEQVNTILAIPFDKMTADFYQAEKLYLKALAISTKNKTLEKNAAIHNALAKSFYYQGKYDESLKHNLSAIKYYETSKNFLKAGDSYASLGYQIKRRDLNKAFEFMDKGIRFLESSSSQSKQKKRHLSAAYNNYGVLFEMNNNIDSALFYYHLGLSIVEEIRDSIGIPYSLNNIAGALVIKEDYKDALSYYNKAFAIRKKRNDVNGLIENYTYFGDLAFKQKNYQEASINYLAALEKAQLIKYTYLNQVLTSQLALCYQHLNMFDLALSYQEQQQYYKDSLLNETTNNTIAQLETQFETEKKEKTIAQQQLKINQTTIKVKQRNYLLFTGIGAVIITLIIGWFYYHQTRLKQQQLIEKNRLNDEISKAETIQKLSEERLRISRDLHDNIGSQLTFIISSIDNLNYKIKKSHVELSQKLNTLSEFSRNAITQLRTTINTLNKAEANEKKH